MHDILTKFMPHALILLILVTLPPEISIYIFIALYIYGIYITAQKEKEDKKNKTKGTLWWEVLGVEPSTSIAGCAKLRKLLAKIYHPDGGKAPNLNAMTRINKAFEQRAEKPDTAGYGQVH